MSTGRPTGRRGEGGVGGRLGGGGTDICQRKWRSARCKGSLELDCFTGRLSDQPNPSSTINIKNSKPMKFIFE